MRCPGAGGWGGLCCALCSCVAVGRRARDRSLVRVPRGDSYVYVCVYGSVYVYERFWCRSLCEYSTRSLQVIKMWLLNGPTGHFPFRGPSWLVPSPVLFRRANRTNLHSAGRGRAQIRRLQRREERTCTRKLPQCVSDGSDATGSLFVEGDRVASKAPGASR